MSGTPSLRQVPCPRCAAPALFHPTNRWRPFCSERCAVIDLGAWATAAYRVEAGPTTQGADGDTPNP